MIIQIFQALVLDPKTGQGWLGRTKNFVASFESKFLGSSTTKESLPPLNNKDRIAQAYSFNLKSGSALPRWGFGLGAGQASPDPRKLPPVLAGATATTGAPRKGGAVSARSLIHIS